MSRRTSGIPFEISRDVGRGLVDQMVDGIRSAIVGGYWRIGESLPSLKEMALRANVSMKVSRMAYARLREEGWLHVTPSVGYTAVTPNVSVWRGRVLLILPLPGYANRIMAKRIQDRLEARGYLVTTFSPQRFDLVLNEDALAALLLNRFDFVFSLLGFPEIRRRLKDAGSPFAVYSAAWRPVKDVGPNCLFDDDSAGIQGLLSYCKARAVKTIVRVDFQDVHKDWDRKFRSAGFDVRYFPTLPKGIEPTLENIRQEAYNAFRRCLSRKRVRHPDLYFFTDDYVAQGALFAFAEAGLEAPGDFRFVTLVNEGLGIAYAKPVTRITRDSLRAGDAAADYILDVLAGGVPETRIPGVSFVPGDTF